MTKTTVTIPADRQYGPERVVSSMAYMERWWRGPAFAYDKGGTFNRDLYHRVVAAQESGYTPGEVPLLEDGTSSVPRTGVMVKLLATVADAFAHQ